MCCAVLSRYSHVQLFATPWTVTLKVPLSMEFSRQEYWSGLPWPPPGNLPHSGTEPASLCLLLWQVSSLSLELPGKPPLISDPHNNGKVWDTARSASMWHRDTKQADALGNTEPVAVFEAGLPQDLQFVKNAVFAKCIKAKHIKMKSAYVRRNNGKWWGISVHGKEHLNRSKKNRCD